MFAAQDSFPPVGIILIAAVVIALIIFQYVAAQRRRKDLAIFAAQNGLEFSPNVPRDYHEQFAAFNPFDQGHSRKASNLINGRLDRVNWEMFDYQYVTGSGKNQTTHNVGVVLARVPLNLVRTQIRPEGLFDKLAAMIGFDDINFESDEFSRAYYVRCTDRKFAYDLIDPPMMEFLLAAPRLHWQLAGGVVLVCRTSRYRPDELHPIMQTISGFLERVPEFVRDDAAAAGRRSAVS